MNEMIERAIASSRAALYKETGGQLDAALLEMIVRKTIASMRELTQEMLNAAYIASINDPNERVGMDSIAQDWCTMIDEILKD